MRIASLIIVAASAAATAPTIQATPGEARLLRFPATNGKEVAFTYGGDIYTAPINGGRARRLTSHVGYEMLPRYSPDGKTIAFTGHYDGNTEVYVMDANGGQPRRLTYTATNARDDIGDRMGPNNMVMTWSPDGKKIVYRNRLGDGFTGRLHTIGTEGGMPQELPLPEGGFCSYSPDGKRLAYNRVMREFRNWKYYRGGMADDIWIYDPEAGKVTNVTDNPAQDIIPMWVGDEIFFLSDRDMTMNIFAYNTLTGATTKVTDFKDYDVKFPSTDGHTIVFENGGRLYRLDPATRAVTYIPITLDAEGNQMRQELKDVSDYITDVSPSPDASRLAVTARGEVFSVPAGKGVTKVLTRTPGANDRRATWSPDGKNIAYISDLSGETEVWLQPADGSEPRQLTTGNDTYIRSMIWSPDSRRLLYTDRKNRIVEVNPATGAKRTVMQNPEGEFYGVSFSPDSRWITYTRPAANEMSVVYVYNLDEGKEYPVTERWYSSDAPVFSTDGRYLIFASARDFNPVYGALEWNHVYTTMEGVYLALLAADTPSPLLPKDESVKTDDEPAAEAPAAKGAKAESSTPQVRIDPDGLSRRLVKLPLPTGSYSGFYSDGKTVWYSSRRTVHAFDLAGQKDNVVAEGAAMKVAPDGKAAVYTKRDEIYVAPLTAGKAQLDKPVDLDGLVATVDYPAEWAQIFDETWRAFRDGFYLENMHGVDWKAIREKYAALLPYVATRLDLNYVIGAMIAELACGHAYVNPGDTPRPENIDMGLLGAELSRTPEGYFHIDRIIPGDVYSEQLRSPLAEPGMGVKEGMYITAVDGIDVTGTSNIYSLLTGKADKLTELTVNTRPVKGGHNVIVKPIADEYPLLHHEWVQNNIRKVEEATDGRVGYIYIPDMGPEGLNEFARLFYPQLDKEALIIDDRANGGGNVSPMIIERLLRKPYRMTMSRHSTRTGTIPDATHHGPKVLLINKYSASDGDLFPWSFKANNLGTVIGTRTWGGIIGISGSLPYMDGTDVRVPFFTNYDAATGEWIVENHGVEPDITVDNDPLREYAGEDQQLNEAIRVALEQLKERKPLPKVPAPRTFRDLGL